MRAPSKAQPATAERRDEISPRAAGPFQCSPSFIIFFNDTATTEIYTLSLHDALPIWYYFTSTGVQSLARAGEIAGWNPDRWPFKGALDVFSDQAIPMRDVLALAVSFILHYTEIGRAHV